MLLLVTSSMRTYSTDHKQEPVKTHVEFSLLHDG